MLKIHEKSLLKMQMVCMCLRLITEIRDDDVRNCVERSGEL